MKVLLLVTALVSAGGQVAPTTQVTELDSMSTCVAMAKGVSRLASEDGYKVFTECTTPRKLEDYK